MAEKVTRKYVESLPLLELSVGGITKSFRYDEEAGKIYALDENGKWTGYVKDYAPAQPAKEPVNDPESQSKATQEPKKEEPKPAPAVPMQLKDVKETDKDMKPPQEKEFPVMPEAMPTQMPEMVIPEQPQPSPEKYTAVEAPITERLDREQEQPFVSDEDLQRIVEETGKRRSSKKQKQDPENSGKQKPSIIKIILYTLVGALLVYGIVVSTFGGKKHTPDNEQTPPETTEAAPVETQVPEETEAPQAGTNPIIEDATEPETQEGTEPSIEETKPESGMVQVLAPVAPIIPGQLLAPEMFEMCEISEIDYRTLSATVGLYTGNDAGIWGLAAVKYIPAGKYLSYEDVGRTFAVVNPWEGETAGYIQTALPVTVDAENFMYLNWGHTIDITITVQTKQTNENTGTGETGETTPEGLEHESSVVESMVIDTYKLTNIQIADIQNASKESLFAHYYAIGFIPSAFQMDYLAGLYQEMGHIQADMPAYVVLCFTQEQADLIAGLSANSMTVTISNPVAISETTYQNEIYTMLQDVQQAMVQAWAAAEDGHE